MCLLPGQQTFVVCDLFVPRYVALVDSFRILSSDLSNGGLDDTDKNELVSGCFENAGPATIISMSVGVFGDAVLIVAADVVVVATSAVTLQHNR